MLGLDPFYHSTIRKMVSLFGTLFNEIEIIRFQTDGVIPSEILHVPLTYARKEKVLARLESDPTITRQAAVQLPRMSFEMTTMRYAGERALPSTQKWVKSANSSSFSHVFMPTPYDFNFSLYTYVKNAEDGCQIMEQILPFFKPEFTVSAELIPELGITKAIPIVLQEVVLLDDGYDGKFEERRALVWQLDFAVKGYLWGPEQTHPVIKFVEANFFDSTLFGSLAEAVGNSQPIDRVTMQPGLTSNGQPTSNVAGSVPYSQISVTDNFGYAANVAGDLDPQDGTGGYQGNNLPYQG